MTIDVTFIDHHRKATQEPDPHWTDGIHVNLAGGAPLERTCCRNLPYPAPGCGLYQIVCTKCGYRALITVAGRTDDPNMISLPCKSS